MPFVKPKTGLRIRVPETFQVIPDAGDDAPDSAFLQRRIKDGDLIIVKPAMRKPIRAINQTKEYKERKTL